MITFCCPSCGQAYRVPGDKAGKKTRCARCGAGLVVPAPPADPPPAPARTPAAGDPPPVAPVPTSAWPRPAAPAESRWSTRQARAAGLAAGAVCLVVVVVAATRGGREGGAPLPAEAASPQPPPASPAELARRSFAALAARFRQRAKDIEPMPVTGPVSSGFDLTSDTELSVDCKLSYLPSVRVAEDVLATTSLVAPFKGMLRFGARVEGTMSGAQWGEGPSLGTGRRSRMPFSFMFMSDENVSDEYDYQDGRWSLGEVRFTTTDFEAVVPYDREASFMSQMIALGLNRSKERMVGHTRKMEGATAGPLFRVLRESASE